MKSRYSTRPTISGWTHCTRDLSAVRSSSGTATFLDGSVTSACAITTSAVYESDAEGAAIGKVASRIDYTHQQRTDCGLARSDIAADDEMTAAAIRQVGRAASRCPAYAADDSERRNGRTAESDCPWQCCAFGRSRDAGSPICVGVGRVRSVDG